MSKKRLNALENFEVEPSPEVWKRIEDRLPLKKKRRWLIWIFPSFLVLTGLWFYLSGFDSAFVFRSTDKPVDVNAARNFSERQIKQNEGSKVVNNNSRSPEKENDNVKSKSVLSLVRKDGPDSHNPKQPAISKTRMDLSTTKKPVTTKQEESYSGFMRVNNEEIPAMASLTYIPEMHTVSKDVKAGKESKERTRQLSRWSIYSGIAYTYAHAITQKQGTENSDYTIKGLRDIGWNAGFSYDASPRIQFSAGVSVYTAGEEKRGVSSVILKGSPGDPNNTYSIVSSSGNIAVSGLDFNIAYYESADSALFSPSATLTLVDGSSKSVKIYMKQEFELLEFPIAVNYKFVQRKITPFAGITLSPVFILKKKVFLEKSEIRYNYENAVANQFFTMGLSAGVNLALSSRLGIYTSGFYKKGLSTIINNEHAKKSVYTGITAGLTYRFSR